MHGSIFRFDGQVTTFVPRRGPLLPLPVPRAAAGAPRAVAARRRACSASCRGIIGIVQATEAIKLILGKGDAADRPSAHVRLAAA